MKRIWPIIAVENVAASSKFYLALFGQAPRSPHHDDFDTIEDSDGTMLLCLHQWAGHGAGPPLDRRETDTPGNGVLLMFRVDDFDQTLARARDLVGGNIESAIGETGTLEFNIRDLDGYYVSVAAF